MVKGVLRYEVSYGERSLMARGVLLYEISYGMRPLTVRGLCLFDECYGPLTNALTIGHTTRALWHIFKIVLCQVFI